MRSRKSRANDRSNRSGVDFAASAIDSGMNNVAVMSVMGMDGDDGAWPQGYGATLATATVLAAFMAGLGLGAFLASSKQRLSWFFIAFTAS